MIPRGATFVAFGLTAVLLAAAPTAAQGRNASFIDPSAMPGKDGKNTAMMASTVAADPPQTDAGETLVNVARRVTVFFFNGARNAVQLKQLTINADGNVRSKVLADDCRSLRTLPPLDRCSIAMEVVPTSPGPWSVEVLLNHSGPGRIARGEILGTTLGKTDGRAEGLTVSKKIAAALEFGDVRVGVESVARTMLIENDSSDPLDIDSIDLVDNGDSSLRLRDSGCQRGDSLRSGESCPITIMWTPRRRGSIATDLIVHHSGNLGFVVVPIRGKAVVDEEGTDGGSGSASRTDSGSSGASLVPKGGGEMQARVAGAILAPPSAPAPPSVSDIVKSLPKIKDHRLSRNKSAGDATPGPALSLIGTVNNRAILGSVDGQTYVIGLGETAVINDEVVALLQLDPTRAVVNISGARRVLALRQAPTIRKSSTALGGASSSPSASSTSEPLGTVSAPEASSISAPPVTAPPSMAAPETSLPPPPAAPTLNGLPPGSG